MLRRLLSCVSWFDAVFFFFNDTATTEIYTLSLHDALPISRRRPAAPCVDGDQRPGARRQTGRDRRSVRGDRSEEHTSELQSHSDLVCRLLLEKKKNNIQRKTTKGAITNQITAATLNVSSRR